MNESAPFGRDRSDWEEFRRARARFFERLELQSVLARMERALGGEPLLPAAPPDPLRPSPVPESAMGDDV